MPGKRPAALARGGDHRRMSDEAAPARDLHAELAAIRDTIARHKRDLGAMIGDGKERHKERPLARAADELGAAVDGMETATQKILKSVEIIDESARALSATLQDDYKRGLAQDIQEHVVQVFESCNFQDLAGQRIGNVIATLSAIEEQVSAMLTRCDGIGAAAAPQRPARGNGLINGPKLAGDAGHASQHDIDRMFG